MSVATKYNPLVAWRTLASQVFQLTRETTNDPATYRATVATIDSNEPGAGTKATGYYLLDYWGVPYTIIATASGTVDVRDDFRVGRCPTSGQMAIIYKSPFDGRSLALSQDNFRFLHPMAAGNAHKYDTALLWANDPNVKKVPFTATATPTISTYQVTQVDPEDGAKTINYASDFGENPLVRCMITVDSTHRYQLQQMPQFTFVTGLIDTVYFDLGDTLTGYILISKA
jgi:hypothetical protein